MITARCSNAFPYGNTLIIKIIFDLCYFFLNSLFLCVSRVYKAPCFMYMDKQFIEQPFDKLKEAGVINRTTVSTLGLKPVTRSMCHDFYLKINTECNSPDAIRESASWWQEDKEKLNRLWWVLNYYSDRLDPDRNLRAHVEKRLDALAQSLAPADTQDDTSQDKTSSLN